MSENLEEDSESYLGPENQVYSSVDRALELLKAEPRRDVISFLHEEGSDSVERREIAEVLSEEPDRYEVTLDHIHLSKLDGAGVLDYDSESGVVEPNDEAVENLYEFREQILAGVSESETE